MSSSYIVGNAKFDVNFEGPSNYGPNITKFKQSIIFDYPCSVDTNCAPYSFNIPIGVYKFEVWGAQGGRGGHEDTLEAVSGGYSEGIIRIRQRTQVYVFVGGKGVTKGPGGYNGGGSITNASSEYGGSGGGATDIRLIGDTLYHRVIVAGGSGGTEYSNRPNRGGYGGGIEGTRGGGDDPNQAGFGGSQSKGGSQGISKDQYSEDGKFGYGGNATFGQRGGGGGGWYGGGSGGEHGDGGGGSGFVFTEFYQTSIPDGYQLDNDYMLLSGVTIDGSEKQPSPYDYNNYINHSGPGVARITVISSQQKSVFCNYREQPRYIYIAIFLCYSK